MASFFHLSMLSVGAIVLSSCQDYLFEQKCRETVKEARLDRGAITSTPVDILFVVDNSGSMADEQDNLAVNFDRFINILTQDQKADYQIAVVTTDQDGTGELQGLQISTFSSAPPHYLEGTNASDCRPANIANGCFRGDRTRIITSAMSAADQIATFQSNVRVGSCGSGVERGLQAMLSALEQGNGCNAGFLRGDANLVVIFVSDEEDASMTPVEEIAQRLVAIKPASRIRVAAIVGSVNGTASRCRPGGGAQCGSLCDDMPASINGPACNVNESTCSRDEYCQPDGAGAQTGRCETKALQYWNSLNCAWCSYYDVDDCCSALAGQRYIQFAQAIERRVHDANQNIAVAQCRGQPGQRIACLIDSICQENFGDTLARIAGELVVDKCYNLDPRPVFPEGIVVRVYGPRFSGGMAELAFGTDYSVTGDQLCFNSDNAPGEEDRLEVFYAISREDQTDAPRGACGLELDAGP